jgi:hypothetical protein
LTVLGVVAHQPDRLRRGLGVALLGIAPSFPSLVEDQRRHCSRY